MLLIKLTNVGLLAAAYDRDIQQLSRDPHETIPRCTVNRSPTMSIVSITVCLGEGLHTKFLFICTQASFMSGILRIT